MERAKKGVWYYAGNNHTNNQRKRRKLEEADLIFRCSSSFIVYIISYKDFNDAVLKKAQTQF